MKLLVLFVETNFTTMKTLLISILFLVNLFTSISVNATSYINLSVENGLSNRKVFSTTKCHKGYLWFATESGIDKFNGETFYLYSLPSNNSFHTEKPKGIITTENGTIYTFSSHYVYYYDEAADCFKILEEIPISNKESINCIYNHCEGLFIGTTHGLYLKRQTGDIKKIELKNSKNIICITAQNEETLWIGSTHGLIKLSCPDIILNTVTESFNERIQSVYFDKNTEYLWIGTFNNGLKIYDTKNNKEIELPHSKLNLPIRVIEQTDNTNVWVGIDGGGIAIFNRYTVEMIKRYSTQATDDDNIYSNNIYDILSTENFVWVTTYNAGIMAFNKNNITTNIYKKNINTLNTLNDNHVNAILEDSNGNLWFGTNQGLNLFDTKKKEWRNYISKTSANKVILSIHEDKNKRIWAGGYASELICIDTKSNSITPITITKSQTPNKNFVYSIEEDENGDMWFGGIINDLVKYNPDKKIYKRFPIRNINHINNIRKDSLVIATGNGLVVLDKKSENIKAVNLFECKGYKALHAYPFLNSVSEIPSMSGNLWLATEGEGIYIFNIYTNELKNISTKEGLSSDIAYGIMPDDNGYIWVSTEYGLNRINQHTGNIDIFNTWNGIPHNAFNFRAYCKMKNGNMIWGGPEGAVEISPYQISKNNKGINNLRFESFSLFYNKVTSESEKSPLKNSIDNTNDINLKYNQHSFSFDFINLTESKNVKTLYTWYLDGFDKQWSVPSYEHKATYTNVPPGNYTFRVKAQPSGHADDVITRDINIHISKPFWATIWAMLIYTLVSLYIIYLIAKAYKNKLEAKDSDQKIRFFINIAHDIRTPLTLIKAPLNEIEEENLSENGKSALVLAQKNTEKLLSMVGQLLDFQKIEREAMKLYVEETNINDYIINCLSSFQLLAKEKHIYMDIKMPDEKHTGWIDRKKISLIIDNLVSNSIKYTNEYGNICIETKVKANMMTINVIDDGIGISQEAQKKLFNRFYRADNTANLKETGSGIGLMLTKKMVTLHKGKITLTSKENIGTTFSVEIPVNRGSYNNNEILYKEERTKTLTQDSAEEDYSNKLKILLIEDNDELREYLSKLLNKNYYVIDAPNGEEGLEKIKKEIPDFILSDVMMPGISGIELCKKIKSDIDTCHIPLILLTALSEREDIIKGINAGADDYLTKPFDLNILESKINTIIKNRKLFRKKYIDKTAFSSDEPGMNELDKKFMKKVMTYIEERMANEDFSIDNLAIEMAMSRSVFYKKIKSLVGQNPQDFIKDIKMKKAANLLREKKYSISEIAYLIGFPNAKYFSTAFKKYFGVSPSQFNEQENK